MINRIRRERVDLGIVLRKWRWRGLSRRRRRRRIFGWS